MATASFPSPKKEALSTSDGRLNCSICLNIYTDPRVLPCRHTYCKKCIDKLATSGKKGSRAVRCPECRRVCQLGKEGSAFRVHNLRDSLKFSSTSEAPLAQPHRDSRRPECSKHKKMKNHYCRKCQMLVCWKCRFESHKSHLSDVDEARAFFGKHVQEIKSSLEPVNTKIDESKRMLACFDATERQIREKGEIVKREIDQAIKQHVSRFQDMTVTLRKSKEALLRDADTATHQKLKLHSLERAELERVLKQLTSCKEFVEEEIKLRSRYQIKTDMKKLTECISDALSEVKVSELQPRQSADTEYVRGVFTTSPPDVGRVKSTVNYRLVYSLSSVDIPQFVSLGMTTEVSLITSLPMSVKPVQCKLKNVTCSTEAIGCTVKQAKKGQFKVLLNPDQPGMHELSVCINDTHICGSPFKVPVVPITGVGLKTFAIGLKHPCGIAISDDGKHVVVAESQRNCVTVFSSATEETERVPIRRFGRYGWAPGEFIHPTEVKISHDYHIFVKDEDRIQIFTLDGLHIHSIYDIELDFGSGMTVLPCGSILTSGKRPSRLLTRSSIVKLRLVPPKSQTSWQSHWQLSEDVRSFDGEPLDIALDTKDRTYVLTKNDGILVFTSKDMADVIAKDDNQLNDPRSFCIDSNNIIYATDGHEVKMYTTKGQFLGSFGDYPKLRGIAVSKTGDLYICKANGEVLVSRNTK